MTFTQRMKHARVLKTKGTSKASKSITKKAKFCGMRGRNEIVEREYDNSTSEGDELTLSETIARLGKGKM